jgi:GTP diphosphokinase / guanosine-3',5'-bis(diphosphate) 3'-diphosphatase
VIAHVGPSGTIRGGHFNQAEPSVPETTRQRELALIIEALGFAARKHRDQRRKDCAASPYINHPIALIEVLCNEAGITQPEVLCAALLHDTIEDTETTAEELAAAFGSGIAAIVLEVTDDKDLTTAQRKRSQVERAGGASREARLVKLADKICNLRDVARNAPVGWDLCRRQAYFDWALEVVDQMRGTHAGLEALFDAAYRQRPRA